MYAAVTNDTFRGIEVFELNNSFPIRIIDFNTCKSCAICYAMLLILGKTQLWANSAPCNSIAETLHNCLYQEMDWLSSIFSMHWATFL